MSSLLTQVVRRQSLMMVPRRQESALIIAGPPMNIVSKKEKLFTLALFVIVPMLYPTYIMFNLQKYNNSNRTWAKKKKSHSEKK